MVLIWNMKSVKLIINLIVRSLDKGTNLYSIFEERIFEQFVSLNSKYINIIFQFLNYVKN